MEAAYAETVQDLISRLQALQSQYPEDYPLRWAVSMVVGQPSGIVVGDKSWERLLKIMPGLRPREES